MQFYQKLILNYNLLNKKGDINMTFTIPWVSGCVNDCIIQYCEKHGIDWRFNEFCKLELNVNDIWMIPCIATSNHAIMVIS